MKKSLMKLTKNKYVFYVVSLLAILNVLGYFSMRSWNCIVMFAAVAYSTKCYAKNNVIAVLAGLFVANFVFGCNQVKENFEEALKPGDNVEKVMDGLKTQLQQTGDACPEGKEKDDAGNCVDIIDDVQDKMKTLQQTMKGMKGMKGMQGMISALTNMGK